MCFSHWESLRGECFDHFEALPYAGWLTWRSASSELLPVLRMTQCNYLSVFISEVSVPLPSLP